MHVPQFQPRQGVQIETDPKATSVGSAAALGDDEGVIDALIKRLQVQFAQFHAIAAPHAMLMKLWCSTWGLWRYGKAVME